MDEILKGIEEVKQSQAAEIAETSKDDPKEERYKVTTSGVQTFILIGENPSHRNHYVIVEKYFSTPESVHRHVWDEVLHKDQVLAYEDYIELLVQQKERAERIFSELKSKKAS